MRWMFLIILFYGLSASAQKDSTIYIKEFGWTLHVPSTFRLTDVREEQERQLKASRAANGTSDSTDLVILVSVALDKTNGFAVNYNLSKNATAANYDSLDKTVKAVLYQTLKSKIPALIDSSGSAMVIDGIKFKKVIFTIHLNTPSSIHMAYATTFNREHLLTYSYVYTDPLFGEQVEKMFAQSAFEK